MLYLQPGQYMCLCNTPRADFMPGKILVPALSLRTAMQCIDRQINAPGMREHQNYAQLTRQSMRRTVSMIQITGELPSQTFVTKLALTDALDLNAIIERKRKGLSPARGSAEYRVLRLMACRHIRRHWAMTDDA